MKLTTRLTHVPKAPGRNDATVTEANPVTCSTDGSRSERIDALRGLAVALVVLGHAVQRNVGATAPLFLFVAAFEMSLFALVSGYLTRPPSGSAALAWLANRAHRLLVPFTLWAPILWFMSRFTFTGLDVVGIPESLPSYLLSLLPRPDDGLWYLLVLFWWCAAVAAAAHGKSRPAAAVVLRTILAVSGLAILLQLIGRIAIPGDFGSIALISLGPFFLAGFVMRIAGQSLSERARPWSAVLGLVLLGLLFASTQLTLPEPGLTARGVALAKATLGVTGSVALLRAIPERVAPLTWLAVVGRSSLGVYAMHLLFLRTGTGVGALKAATSFLVAMALSLVGSWLLGKNVVTAALFLGQTPAPPRRIPKGPTRKSADPETCPGV